MKDNFNWFEVEAGVNSRNLMTDMFHAPAIPFEYIEYQRNATQTKLAGYFYQRMQTRHLLKIFEYITKYFTKKSCCYDYNR